MKKYLLIAAGVLIVVLLIALWMYLLFFGTPKSVDEVFTGFGFGNETTGDNATPPIEQAPTPAENPVVNMNRKALRQLTTRPVIGYREIQATASSTPYVYYAEAGTGHVYSINLTSGEEVRLSGTTVAEASRADFSDDGRYIVMQSGYGRVAKTAIGEISTSTSVQFTDLPDSIDDFMIARNNELLYTVRGAVTTGKAMSLSTRATRILFTLPFREAIVSWGSTATTTHYIHPKSSYLLQGFVYSAQGGKLTRVPLSGFGLTADGGGTIALASYTENETLYSYLFNTKTGARFAGSFIMFPEKCTFSYKTPGKFWCASYVGDSSFGFPDTWYRGEVSSQDVLYEVEITADSIATTNLVDTFADTSREVDVIGMTTGRSEDRLYFMNKNDNTLWLYDLSL